MTDLLLDIPESVPKWRKLASVHGIVIDAREDGLFDALYDDNEGPMRSVDHETEKEAVISLIHKLMLNGWKEVTL